MRTSEQINAFWRLAREKSADGETVRRRIGALSAMMLVVSGFLVAIGLAALVLAMIAGALLSIALIVLLGVWPRVRRRAAGAIRCLRAAGLAVGARLARSWHRAEPHVKTSLVRVAHRASAVARLVLASSFRTGRTITRAVRSHGGRTGAALVPLWGRARSSSAAALASARPHAAAVAHAALEEGSRVGRELARAGRTTAIRFAPRPARVEPQREALRLNAAGTQHRRNGRYDEAVECHRRALEILRALDDRRAVALTQSNLALALSHAGDDDWAIGLFEEAAATLRDLGDEEHEAQIIANLGIAHRRHGRRDEANNVLELALSKLSPASSAYHTIEAELRRAS
jgi:tetratricopeptide (TPR) repeat protein